jgi:DNA invertase Pin-like site-specific DNA recombinase
MVDPKLRRSRYRGGIARINRAHVQMLKTEGLGPSEIAARLSISRMSVYRILKENPAGTGETLSAEQSRYLSK